MSSGTIARAEILGRARALVPFLSEKATETERNRSMLPEIHDRLMEAGLFHIMMAPRLGGLGLDVATHLEVAGILAEGCGSSAWVQNLVGYQNMLVGWYPRETQDEVIADGRPVFSGLVMGPPVFAEKVGGGVRLSGRWPYVSGIDQSTWLQLSAKDPDITGGKPRVLTCLLPREQAVVDDDWHCMGLKGTGSKTAVLKDVFVPAHRVMCFREIEKQGIPGAAVNDGAMYGGIPNSTLFAMVVAAPAVGLAAGALAAYRERLASRTNARMPSSQTEWPTSQSRLGRARVRLDIAQRAMKTAADNVVADIEGGAGISPERQVFYRIEMVEIIRICTEIIYELFCDSGTGASMDGNVLQRAFRDIHVLRSHFVLTPEFAEVNAGRVQLDLGPTGPFV
jgi:3-hydroxy-9,10-secoandrosta-1,3,5(10)-triene-9,17-dione monooxygenase